MPSAKTRRAEPRCSTAPTSPSSACPTKPRAKPFRCYEPGARVIDASTAHRTAPGWTYGFPEIRRHAPGRDRGLEARLQPRLLRTRRHLDAAPAGERRAAPGRPPGDDQRRLRLHRRRQEAHRGVRRPRLAGRHRQQLLPLRPRPGAQARAGDRAARLADPPAAVRAERRTLRAGHDRLAAAAALVAARLAEGAGHARGVGRALRR